MDAKENALVAISKIPANTGHTLHKGTPREAFIREFLEKHLPESVAIGSGEIIDANSKPGQQRNQFDIVVYKKSYPKLDFGGDISGFLIESVIATVEVKSTLTQADMEQAVNAARNAKSLVPNFTTSFHSGYVPPKVLNYVVAYDGPAKMETVYNWISPIYSKLGLPRKDLPKDEGQRLATPSASIDGVFILNRGFLYFDNVPCGFCSSTIRNSTPLANWIHADSVDGNLLFLFTLLQSATANIEGKWLNPVPYLSSFQVNKIAIAP